jgi:hypothetical protein
MEVIYPSETSVLTIATRRHIPEDDTVLVASLRWGETGSNCYVGHSIWPIVQAPSDG